MVLTLFMHFAYQYIHLFYILDYSDLYGILYADYQAIPFFQ